MPDFSSATTVDVGTVERLTTSEVMSLARISRATLWRRVAAGHLPRPVGRGRQALFSRFAVIRALETETIPFSVTVATEQRLETLRRRAAKRS